MQNFSLVLFLFLLLAVRGFGQSERIESLREDYDKRYGLDMLLHNGEKFVDEVDPIKGHPFWQDEAPFIADLYLSGQVFPDQKLQYHLYRQVFILSYTDYNQQPNQIVLNKHTIDSVRTGDLLFVRHNYPNIAQPYVSLISDGELMCFIGYQKDLNFRSQGNHIGYEYTDEIREFYLWYQDVIHRFRKKGTFLGIFAREHRRSIRKFMSSEKLKLKTIDVAGLKKLVIYCEHLVMEK